jgi:molecular chaperone DnaK
MTSDDAGRIRQGIEALSRAAMRIGEAVQRSAQTDTGSGGTAGPADERVVDAEFEDVDDPKRRAS